MYLKDCAEMMKQQTVHKTKNALRGKSDQKKPELESKPTKSAQAEEKISKTWMGRTECVALYFMERRIFFTPLTLFRLRENS